MPSMQTYIHSTYVITENIKSVYQSKFIVKSHSQGITVFLSYVSKPNATCTHSQTHGPLKMQAF